MDKPSVAFVVGTRPEAIKTAPVVLEFRKHARLVDTLLISTGQHREMLDQALGAFDLRPDVDLNIMRHGQTLAEVTTRSLDGLDKWLAEANPAMVFAQGDTTTTFAASLASFYREVPFGHIEAGLRTDNIRSPYPEEFNRRATGLTADWHFAPTSLAAQNLLKEGKPPERVIVTGNTVVDAVLRISEAPGPPWFPEHKGRVVLLTTHRRENWGEPQRDIARAARKVVDLFDDVLLVAAMHRNPAVRDSLASELGGHPRVRLIEPPAYSDFVRLLKRSFLVLTDSGGVQEEAPAFGIPVLVLRDTTERPEGVEAGTAKLVGTDAKRIEEESMRLLSTDAAYAAMAQVVSPYGDGRASARIRKVSMGALGLDTPEESL